MTDWARETSARGSNTRVRVGDSVVYQTVQPSEPCRGSRYQIFYVTVISDVAGNRHSPFSQLGRYPLSAGQVEITDDNMATPRVNVTGHRSAELTGAATDDVRVSSLTHRRDPKDWIESM